MTITHVLILLTAYTTMLVLLLISLYVGNYDAMGASLGGVVVIGILLIGVCLLEIGINKEQKNKELIRND